jgi:hypothetical protein
LTRGRIPKSTYDQAKNALDTAQQALLRAQAERETAAAEQRTASITGQEVRLIDFDLSVLDADLQKAEARVEAQKVVLEQHTIRAPIDGVIDELFYDAGEHSLQGFRMALMHDPDAVWVSANIKETDIRNVHVGAPVRVRADSNPGDALTGRVSSIREATLSEAAMMPNPNANGVFTKITQRIKVRIDLDAQPVHLRTGTMVSVRIRKSGRRAGRPGRAVSSDAALGGGVAAPLEIPSNASNAIRDRFAQFGANYRWFLLLTMLMGSMATMLAATTINVALPAIIGAFGLGQDQAQWMSTAFLASSTLAMLANAWAMATYGPACDLRVRHGFVSRRLADGRDEQHAGTPDPVARAAGRFGGACCSRCRCS